MRNILIALLIAGFVGGCATNAVTGRKQLSLVSESELQLMATNQYQAFLKENKPLPSSNSQAAMVDRVGERIANAITRYYTNEGKGEVLEGYQWEFNTVESKDANAWCMPGGKVVVYTGLLPITQDETGLAIVMGHEIAHAIASHGNERMSAGMVQQGLGAAVQVAMAQKPAETQNLFLTAFGVGSQVFGILPFSRKQETEADEFGLIFAAMAGYDPRQAVPFWERMAQQGGGAPPEFLSTHPSNQTRIRNLERFMPKAMKYYTGKK